MREAKTRACFSPTLAAALLLCLGRPSFAQQGASGAPSLEDLARLVNEQRKLVETQQALVLTQGREIAELRRMLDETSALALLSHNRLEGLEQKSPQAGAPVAAEEPLTQAEVAEQRIPEREQTMVTAGDFPRSLRIPGTDAALRIGGLVRMTAINSLAAIGTDDRFVTSSIPVAGTEAAGKGDRTTYSARPSRFNFDLRTPTGVGAMRAFIEGDFAGPGNSFRLRHAYGQWQGLTLGQTWSTFSDREAEPDGIDFEGLNAISLFRQPQIRWTHPLREGLALALAAENPAPDISAADGSPIQGVNQAPDLIARLRWTPGLRTLTAHGPLAGGGHVQAALLVRQVRGEYEPNATLSTQAIGYHISGRLRTPWLGGQDQIPFATAGGKGIGRYITDLGTLGGQDAVYDPATNTLEALPVLSAYIGYEHAWSKTARSTLTWGSVFVDNLAVQSGDALRRTDRATINFSWSPIARIDIVSELLWGRRINKDGQRGEAKQIQVGTNFRF